MNFSWQNINDFGTFIAFPDSIRSIPYPGSLGIPKPGLLGSSAGEKNGLRSLRLCPSYLLRPEDPQGSRSVLRRHADLPGSGDPPGLLSQVPEGETGKAGLAGRLSFLHQAICLLRRPSVSGFESSGCGQGIAPGLEDGQGPGDAVHAGAAAAERERRGRRSLVSTKFPSAKGIRTGSWSVTWNGSGPSGLEGKDRSEESMDLFFKGLGPKKSQGNPVGGHGYVEGLP